MILWRSIVCTAAAVCLIAPTNAQSVERPVKIGLLCAVTCDYSAIVAFKGALGKLGWVEGRNLVLDARGAGGRTDQLPELARDIVASRPDLIVAAGPQPSKAAHDAAGMIPVLFIAVADPVAVGLVRSLGHPGGNVTGFSTLAPGGFIAKTLELIRELAPRARRVAVLMNPSNDVARLRYAEEGPQAAARLGMQIQMLEVREPTEIAPAIEGAARQGAEVLYIPGDSLFHIPPDRVPPTANRVRLPSGFLSREVVQAGGLLSYGPDFIDIFTRAAGHADRILRGAKPSDLPVEQPTKYLLVVNLKTAKAIGFSVPRSLLLRADEVIE